MLNGVIIVVVLAQVMPWGAIHTYTMQMVSPSIVSVTILFHMSGIEDDFCGVRRWRWRTYQDPKMNYIFVFVTQFAMAMPPTKVLHRSWLCNEHYCRIRGHKKKLVDFTKSLKHCTPLKKYNYYQTLNAIFCRKPVFIGNANGHTGDSCHKRKSSDFALWHRKR